jgi:hypothetical protein
VGVVKPLTFTAAAGAAAATSTGGANAVSTVLEAHGEVVLEVAVLVARPGPDGDTDGTPPTVAAADR